MLVKFDAHKVFKVSEEMKLNKVELKDIIGFMVTDIIERLNPFDDAVEIDITERMAEGIEITGNFKQAENGKESA